MVLAASFTDATWCNSPGRPFNSSQSSVISTQSLGENRSTLSLPVLATVRVVPPVITLTAVATEALSRDHLKVAVPDGAPPAGGTPAPEKGIPRR